MGTNKLIRVFLVDDHALVRAGLRALIEGQSDLCVVGEASDGEAALSAVESLEPEVVVMDISMPKLNGADATARMRQTCPSARVLVLTAHEENDYVQLLLQAGACGFLLKRAAAADLLRAIRAVAAGHAYEVTGRFAGEPARPPLLTPARRPLEHELSDREAEVLKMVALGYSMKRMAAKLELSPRTLETYRKRAMSKLDLSSRADIVRFALEQGWLQDG